MCSSDLFPSHDTQLALAGTAEGLQEAAEGFLQRVNTQLFINPDREDYSMGEATGDAAIGGAVGATMQGLVYLALHISNRKGRRPLKTL